MNTKIILIAIVIIVIVAVGIFAASTMTNTAQTPNNVSAKGTKLDLKNTNNQYWEHLDIVIENVTFKNGTKGNLYMEAWVKPGENLTIDLSQLMGYGNEQLPNGTVIKPLIWGSVLNTTAGGSSSFSMILQGWSNTATPVSAPQYNVTFANMPVGPLPNGINGNMYYYNYTKADIDAFTAANHPHTDQYEIMFTVITMTVDPNSNPVGNLIMTFSVPPTLCSTIAHIISA